MATWIERVGGEDLEIGIADYGPLRDFTVEEVNRLACIRLQYDPNVVRYVESQLHANRYADMAAECTPGTPEQSYYLTAATTIARFVLHDLARSSENGAYCMEVYRQGEELLAEFPSMQEVTVVSFAVGQPAQRS